MFGRLFGAPTAGMQVDPSMLAILLNYRTHVTLEAFSSFGIVMFAFRSATLSILVRRDMKDPGKFERPTYYGTAGSYFHG